MKRGPSKGQRKDSFTGLAPSMAATQPLKKEQLSPVPLFRKRAFSTVNNNTLPPPNTLPYPQQYNPDSPQQAFRPMARQQQDRLPSIDFLTMNQNWPRPQFNFQQSPHPYPPQEDLRSGYTSRSNSLPSYLPSESEKCQNDDQAPLSPKSSAVQGDVWQDRQVDSYYQIIHPTLPILPSSKVRLKSFLAACPNENLRTAVLVGLNGLGKKMSDPRASMAAYKAQLLQTVSDITTSSGGLISAELPLESRSLFLVCHVFLFLYTDESSWLATAVSIAYSMNLHVISTDERSRRLFLVLVVLDSLNSAVKSVPSFIPEDMIHFDDDRDALCFGSRTGVELLRLCIVLRHVSRAKQQQINNGGSSLFARGFLDSLDAELAAVKREVEGMWDTVPILKALYHSVLVNLCALHLQSSSETPLSVCKTMMSDLTELSSLLVSPLISVSPLMGYFYHFICEGSCNVVEVLYPDMPGAAGPSVAKGLRDQALKLIEYLQQNDAAATCLFSVRPAMVRRMAKLQSAAAKGPTAAARDRPAQSPGGYSDAHSPTSASSLSTSSTAAPTNGRAVSPMKAPATMHYGTSPQLPQPQRFGSPAGTAAGPHNKSPSLRSVMMTSRGGLDRLANVAEKVKLLV